MSSDYAPSISGLTFSSSTSSSRRSTTSSSSSSKLGKEPRLSSGRGGSGNSIRASKLSVDPVNEEEILQRIQSEASLDPRVKVINSGRGGTGNILTASEIQSIPFDVSADPDDSYEQIVLEDFQKVKKVQISSTGRGGSGNLSGPTKEKKAKSRRRRSSASGSASYRFSSSASSSVDNYDTRTTDDETASLSPSIIASPLTPGLPLTPSPLSSRFPPISPCETIPEDHQRHDTKEDTAEKDTNTPEGRYNKRGERKWWKFGRHQRTKKGKNGLHTHAVDTSVQEIVWGVEKIDLQAKAPRVLVENEELYLSGQEDDAFAQGEEGEEAAAVADDEKEDNVEGDGQEEDENYDALEYTDDDGEVWRLKTVREGEGVVASFFEF